MEKCMYGHIYNRKRYGDLCPFCSMERRQKETEGAKPAGLSLHWIFWKRRCGQCAAG